MVNSWAPQSLHYLSLQHCCNILICIWHVGNWYRDRMTDTRPQGQFLVVLCHWNASKGIKLTITQSSSQSKLWGKKHFSFCFPNTAEQTPPKHQGSVSFQKLLPFDKWSKPDIIRVLMSVLVEPNCSNPVHNVLKHQKADYLNIHHLLAITYMQSGPMEPYAINSKKLLPTTITVSLYILICSRLIIHLKKQNHMQNTFGIAHFEQKALVSLQ